MYVETSRDSLEGVLGFLNVGIEFADVILKPLNPALLLGNALTTFFFTAADQLHEVISQPLILFVTCVGEGGADNSNDGQGEGLRM